MIRFMRNALPDILAKNLSVVFCGINPALTAAVSGRHFMSGTNRFWRVLHLSGFTPEQAVIPKGWAFIWAANLAHGGAPIEDPASTRRSLVVHNYFAGCTYYTPMHSDEASGRQFIVMEWVDGPSCAEILRELGRLDPADAVSILTQSCRGLDYAHRKGVVHRDVKPGNLLRGSDGGQVKLADFGIAKAAEQSARPRAGR